MNNLEQKQSTPKFDADAKLIFSRFIQLRNRFNSIVTTMSDSNEIPIQDTSKLFINLINRLCISKQEKHIACASEFILFFNIYVYQRGEMFIHLEGSPIYNTSKSIDFLNNSLTEIESLIIFLEKNPKKMKETIKRNPKIGTSEEAQKLDSKTRQIIRSRVFGDLISKDTSESESTIKMFSHIFKIFMQIREICMKYDVDCFSSYENFKTNFCFDNFNLISKKDFELIRKGLINNNFEWYNGSDIFETYKKDSTSLMKFIELLHIQTDSFVRHAKQQFKQNLVGSAIKPDPSYVSNVGNENVFNIRKQREKLFSECIDKIQLGLFPNMGTYFNLTTQEGRNNLIFGLGDPEIINEEDIKLILELRRDNYKWDTLKDKGDTFDRANCRLFEMIKDLQIINLNLDSLINRVNTYNSKRFQNINRTRLD